MLMRSKVVEISMKVSVVLLLADCDIGNRGAESKVDVIDKPSKLRGSYTQLRTSPNRPHIQQHDALRFSRWRIQGSMYRLTRSFDAFRLHVYVTKSGGDIDEIE
jgi:hypothetical protein